MGGINIKPFPLTKPIRALYLSDLIVEVLPAGAVLRATGRNPFGDTDIIEVRWGMAVFAVVYEDLIQASETVNEAI